MEDEPAGDKVHVRPQCRIALERREHEPRVGLANVKWSGRESNTNG